MSHHAIDVSNPRSARVSVNDELHSSTHRSVLGQRLDARARAGDLSVSVDGTSVTLSRSLLSDLANAGGTSARVALLMSRAHVTREQALNILNGIANAGPSGPVSVASSRRAPASSTPPAARPATLPPTPVVAQPAIAPPVTRPAPRAHIGNSESLDLLRREAGSPLTVVYNGQRYVVQPNEHILSSPRFRALPPAVQSHVLRAMSAYHDREARNEREPLSARSLGYGHRLEIEIRGSADQPTGSLTRLGPPAPQPVDAAIEPGDAPIPTTGGMDGGVDTHRDAG